MGKPARNWEALIDATTKATGSCHMCRDAARPDLVELLKTIRDKQAHRVGVPQMYEILSKAVPGFSDRVGPHAFRNHVRNHEALWLRAKPKASK